jgi:hypothetical protein
VWGLWSFVNDEHDLVRAWGNLRGHLHREDALGSNHGRRFNRPHGLFSFVVIRCLRAPQAWCGSRR